MKVAWFSIPAYGHTNPTINIVKTLVERGHIVYYFSFEMFRKRIESTGAKFISCDGINLEIEDEGNGDRVGKDMAFAVKLLVSSVLAMDDFVTEKIREIRPDVTVSDSVSYWGKLTALKFNIPYVSSTTTFAFNRYSARYIKDKPGNIIKMAFSLGKIRKEIKRLREKGYRVKNFLDIIQNDNNTNTIVYTSKYFQPCSDTFSLRYHFIGPSIRKIESPIEKTNKTTIYISLGTVNQNREFFRNSIKALGETGWQVIISTGANSEKYDNLPDNIKVYESVDQMAVLSIADAFITHAGMNSASEGLFFSVPLVLFPQTPEQGAVSRRVEELGAGLHLNSISPSDILSSLKTVLGNPIYKENARKIAESFRLSGGADEAAIFIEEVAAT